MSAPGTTSKKQGTGLVGAAFAVVLAVAAALAVPAAASAHEDGEAEEGYLLVQQALAHLAHDTSDEGIHLAMEKVDEALETEDQEGLDVAGIEDAMVALEAGQVATARDHLQASIEEALHDLPLATGTETGTTVVVPETSGGSGIDSEEWGLLIASFALLLLGVWLAVRFRPRDTVRALRRSLAGGDTDESAGTPGTIDRGGAS